MKRSLNLLAGICLLLSACSKNSSTNNPPFVIDPGVSFGKINFTTTREEAIQLLGKPDSYQGMVLNYPSRGFSVVPNHSGRVVAILCGDDSITWQSLIDNF